MSHHKMIFSVGLFILISSVLIIASLVYVVEQKGMFEPHIQYKLIASDAENIEEGMPILFSGFEVGQVEDLGLHDNGEVLVTISVPEHNKKWFRTGARFVLENPLIGKAKITVKSSMKNPPLVEGVILRMQIKDGINEIITNIHPVILELQNIVSNVNILSHSLADKNASFQTSLKHVDTFSARLASSPNVLSSVTGNRQSAIELHEAISNLNLSLKEFQVIAQNANAGVSELREGILQPASLNMQELSLILKDVRYKLKSMDKVLQNLSGSDKDIEYFKDEMKVLLDEMNELSTRVNSMIGKESQDNVTLP